MLESAQRQSSLARTDVETAMRVEEAKLSELQNQTMSADELLTETGSDLDATMSEIDAILGKGGGN